MESHSNRKLSTEDAKKLLEERGIPVGSTAEEVTAEIIRRGFRQNSPDGVPGAQIVRVFPPKEYKGYPVFDTEAGITITLTPEAFSDPTGIDFDPDKARRDALIRAFAEAVQNVEKEAAEWEKLGEPRPGGKG